KCASTENMSASPSVTGTTLAMVWPSISTISIGRFIFTAYQKPDAPASLRSSIARAQGCRCPRSIGRANMQHGVVVGIDALPAADIVEQSDRRRRGRQQHGVDLPGLEKIEEQADVLELHCAVI